MGQPLGRKGDAVVVAVGEGALPLELVERHHGGVAGQHQGACPVLDRTAAGPIGRSACFHRLAPHVGPHEGTLELGMQATLVGKAAWIGERSPAVIVDREVQRLAGIADEMAPDPQVADRQLFATAAIEVEPGTVGGISRGARPDGGGPPIGEVLHQLLPAIDDRQRQVARAVLGGLAGAQRAVVGLARRRHRLERHQSHHQARIVEADEVPRIALLVVRVAGTLRAVELAPKHRDLGDCLRLAHEGRDLLGQHLGGDAAHELMTGRAPRQGWRERGEEQRHGVEQGDQAAASEGHHRRRS